GAAPMLKRIMPIHHYFMLLKTDIACVRILLNYQADPHIEDKYKRNPLCDINTSNHKHPLALYELLLKNQSLGCFWEYDSFISDKQHKSLIQLAVKYYDPKHLDFPLCHDSCPLV
ncbi:MAG: hypothetical protein L0H63_03980, partial [Nitrococcus sp.]|nr:hypothetical protein [Nitrococcus sp.]